MPTENAPPASSAGGAPLEERERMAIEELRAHARGLTLDEIGEREGLCRERIRQIEKRALARLALALARQGLDGREVFGDDFGV